MVFKSINPYNNEEVGDHIALTSEELNQKLSDANSAYKVWSQKAFSI